MAVQLAPEDAPRNAESGKDAAQATERCVPLAALHASDVRSVKPGLVSERLLGESSAFPQGAENGSQGSEVVRLAHPNSKPDRCLWVYRLCVPVPMLLFSMQRRMPPLVFGALVGLIPALILGALGQMPQVSFVERFLGSWLLIGFLGARWYRRNTIPVAARSRRPSGFSEHIQAPRPVEPAWPSTKPDHLKSGRELDMDYLATVGGSVPPHAGTSPMWRLSYQGGVRVQRDMAWQYLEARGGRRDMDLAQLAAISPGAVGRILEADVYLDGRELTERMMSLVDGSDRDRITRAAQARALNP